MIAESLPFDVAFVPEKDERPPVAVVLDRGNVSVLTALERVARPVVFRNHSDLVEAARTTDFRRVIASPALCTVEFLSSVTPAVGPGALAFWYGEGAQAELITAAAKKHVFEVLPSPEDAGFTEAALHWIRRRSSTRVATGAIDCSLELSTGLRLAGTLRDVSAFGISVRVPRHGSADALFPGARLSDIALSRDGVRILDTVDGVVRHLTISRAEHDSSIDGYLLGIELVPVATRPGQRHREAERLVRDRVQVLGCLRSAVGHCEVTARAANEPDIFACCSAEEVDAQELSLRLTGDLPSCLDVSDSLELSFDLWGKNYRFTTTLMSCDRHGAFVVRVPRVLVERAGREMARFRPRSHTKINAILQSALPGIRPARVEILDITTTGCAIEYDTRVAIFPLGSLITGVALESPDATLAVGAARVRSVERRGAHGVKCGIEFLPLSPLQRAKIYDAVIQCDEPGLRPATGYSFDRLWSFFQETKFLYPAKLEHIDVPAVRATFEVLLDPQATVARSLVFERDGRTYGHVSTLRVYSRTCLAQHLAAQHRMRRVPLGRLLTMAMMRFQDFQPNTEWIKLYYRPNNPWPRLVFGSFAAQAADGVSVDHCVNDYLTVSRGDSLGAVPANVRPIAAAEEPQLEAYFLERGLTAQLRAEDFTPGRLRLTVIDREFREVGLTRRREVLVYADQGRIRGFAALELSSVGLNLSELTNSFQLFLLDEDAVVSQSLAAAAVQRYHELGYARCIALASGEVSNHLQEIGFTKEKEYAALIWHRSTFGHYAEHAHRVTAADYT